MQGKVKKVITGPKYNTYVIYMDDGRIGKTYSSPSFRNYTEWSRVSDGDELENLQWKDEKKGILDADYLIAVNNHERSRVSNT